MVPKVAGKGRSFKGAGLYYLHDKQASTSERVAFTHTENLPTRDAGKAIKCMAWTALRQNELKARSGASAKGRKLTQPVYCYSLSWAPGETPSQEEMIGAAKDTLSILGLSDHEALFVGHNDEPHPHIHVIVNRVHPESGIAAPLSMDHLKLSAWAEEFEKRQGQIRCEQRVENNERRRYGEFVKDHASQHAAEFRRWRQERREQQRDRRDRQGAFLEARHDREYNALCDDRDRRIEGKRRQLQEATRDDWRRLYRGQFEERRKLQSAQRNAWTRLRYFVRTYGAEFRAAGPASRKQMLKGAFAALLGSKRQFAELERRQLAARRAQGNKINAQTEQLTRRIKEDHARKLAEMRKRQVGEQWKLYEQQKQERERQAEERRAGRDKQQFEKERDAQRREDLKQTKDDITRPQPGSNEKSPLRAQFDKAKTSAAKQPGHTKAHSDQVVPRKQDPQTSQSLSEKFRKAQEPGQDRTTIEKLKTNTRDMTQDRDHGRERGRQQKPPGWKPD
jgi:hypothetical protein